MSTILINKAIILSLGELDQPVITRYQLSKTIFKLYLAGKYRGKKLKVKDILTLSTFRRHLDKLLDLGIINENNDFPLLSVFNLLGYKTSNSEQIVCTVDPFCYLSHLTAMSFHGFTDRIPKVIFISSPPPKKWITFARKLMKKEFSDFVEEYNAENLPKLTKINFDKINKQSINLYASVHQGAFKIIKDSNIRVSTIGRTFLDMIRRPDLCGGIHHVIEVFQNHSPTYLDLIIDEMNANGRPIDKVRTGYLLEEKCQIKNNSINKWIKFAQRGGSRKLDSSEEYSPNYSERWCLSINTD